jgi:heat shock protein HslJ
MSSLRKLVAVLILANLPAIGSAAGLEFSGTAWHLVAIHSMDETQGTVRISDPSRFTLEFWPNGRVGLRLDCNSGRGTYELTPAGDGTTGSIRFGPIVATRALCPPPRLDERLARDMAFVRGYLVKDDKLYLSLMADSGNYEWEPHHIAGTSLDSNRMVRPVHFAKGKNTSVIRDRIAGRQYVDYTLRASAGQRMTVMLDGSNKANHFNLLPPDSPDAAMVIGELVNNRFDGIVPDDGVYTIRVFLMRSAGRRQETSAYTLSIGIAGEPLVPVSANVDAVLPGTRYHASATTNCEPLYSQARHCEAYVVRRGFDGTATVELRWDGDRKRRILFVKGEPKAADVPQAMTFTRDDRGWRVSFDKAEHFEIPDALVYGG